MIHLEKKLVINTYVLVFVFVSFILGIVFFLNRQPQRNKLSNTHIPLVVTSFYPLYFFASQIAGNLINVQNITPAGAEPHEYEPTPKDVANIEQSKLLLLNGGGFEPWGERMKTELDPSKVKVIAVGESFINQQVNEDGMEVKDPHIWLSPKLAGKEAQVIMQALKNVDSAHAATYQKNGLALISKLQHLDETYTIGLKDCKSVEIMTSHAAFGYLATSYGLRQTAISGLSPDEEPSLKQLAELLNLAKSRRIKVIFFEKLASPKLAETVAGEIGAKTLILDPIEGVSEEDMKNGKDYFTIMNENLQNLRVALECK